VILAVTASSSDRYDGPSASESTTMHNGERIAGIDSNPKQADALK
jgi:hypothetical protein